MIPAREMERMMKLQDVILKAMAKKITWIEAAEIAGMSVRNMQRKRQAYQDYGYDGLFDQRRGKRSYHRVPMEIAEQVLALYQGKYFDLNVRHFHEKLKEENDIQLSYSWVKQALQGAGLVPRRKKRGTHRRRRPRRPMAGMLLHIDGSKHRWLCDDRYYDLIVILDDATSEIYYAQLVEEESTRTVMAALRDVIERKGVFCALYSDRGSHFFVTPKAGEPVDKTRLTQVGRALKELGVQMIPAYSPQARGRMERSYGTWQGRLPQELRLAGIGTVEEAKPVSAEALPGGVQPKVHGEGGRAGHRLPALRAEGSGVGILDSNRASRSQGQHSEDCRPVVADRQVQMATFVGWSDRDHPPALGWHRVDPLRTARSGPWKRRNRGKPKVGFPQFLGNRLRRFPLSHRLDDDSPSLSQKGEEGCLKPNRTTSVLIKPDNYKS